MATTKEKAKTRAKAARASNKRAPASAKRTTDVDVLARQAKRFAEDGADRHLANYQTLFRSGSADEAYYKTTRAIVVAGRSWRKVANERIKNLGQTMARWETLFLVAYSDDELTQGELARLISVEGPTMVRMLDVLAKDGLIERRQSKTDRRVTTNRITPKGKRVIKEIMHITNQLRADLLSGIDPDELAVCVRVLSQILIRLDEMR